MKTKFIPYYIAIGGLLFLSAKFADLNGYFDIFLLNPDKRIKLSHFVIHILGMSAPVIGAVLAFTLARSARLYDNLREVNDRTANVMTSSKIVAFSAELNDEYQITWVSDTVRDIMGFDPEQVISDASFVMTNIHPEDRSSIIEGLSGIKGREKIEYICRRKTADGAFRWFHERASVVSKPKGRDPHLLITLRDITELRETKLQAAASESRFNALFGSARDGILIADAGTGRFLMANRAICSVLGYEPDEVLTLKVDDIHDKEDMGLYAAMTREPADGEMRTIADVRLKKKNGDIIHGEMSGSSITLDGRPCAVGVFRDTTEKKRMTDQLRRLSLAVDSFRDSVIMTDMGGTITYCNKAACDHYGYGVEELTGSPVEKLYGDPVLQHDVIVPAVRRHGKWSGGVIGRRKDGALVPETLDAMVIHDTGRDAAGMVGIVRDLREIRELTARCGESENRFRSFFNDLNDGVLITDPETGTFVMSNKKICEMLGYGSEELTGMRVYDIHPPYDISRVLSHFEKLKRNDLSVAADMPVVKRDGSVFPADISTSFVEMDGRKYVAALFRDVTGRKDAERDLMVRGRAMDTALSGIAITDMEGAISYVNEAVVNMFGFDRRDEVMGKDMIEMITTSSGAARYKKAMEEHGRYSGMEIGTRIDGVSFYYSILSNVVEDEAGAPICTMASIMDVTERINSELESLEASTLNADIAELSKRIISHAPLGEISAMITDYAKKHTGSAYGYVWYIGPETGCPVSPAFTAAMEGEYQEDERNISLNESTGLQGWGVGNGTPIMLNGLSDALLHTGTPAGGMRVRNVLAVPAIIQDRIVGQIALANPVRDYSEKDMKLAEMLSSFYALAIERHLNSDLLKKERDTARQYLDTIGVMLVVVDRNENVALINKKGAEILGWEEGEVIGKNWFDCCVPEGMRDELRLRFREIVNGVEDPNGCPGALIITRSGDEKTIAWRNSVIRDGGGRITSFICSGEDVTERRIAEEKLVMLHNAVESLMVGVTVSDREGNIVYTNLAEAVMHGYAPEELIGKKAGHLAPPDLHRNRVERENGSRFPMVRESINIRSDGTTFPVRLMSVRVRNEIGDHIGTITICEDITESRFAINALRESEERYGTFLRHFHGIAYRTDLEGVPIFYHGSVKDITGYDEDDLLRKDPAWAEIVDKDGCTVYKGDNGNPECDPSAPVDREYRIVRKDGNIRWVREISQVVQDNGSETKYVQGVMYDITEKVLLQEEAIRKAQLASVGELAASVAHEVNNPLNVVINYAQILCDEIDDDKRENALNIIKEGDRIRSIVTRLLSFTHHDEETRDDHSVKSLVNEIVSLLRPLFRKDNIVVKDLVPERIPHIYVNRLEMQQVILNLINNARDALNEKYPGMHRNKMIVLFAKTLKKDGVMHVRLSILDRGVGIDKYMVRRVMAPFVSTKERGAGTGLGLSICNSIVRNYNGKLSVMSLKGRFTKIDIDVPLERSR